jgi:hypothetical protein
MAKMLRLFIACTLIALGEHAFAQDTSAVHTNRAMHRDSVYTVRENIPKSKLWGNSWYLATAFNWSRITEFDINVGRTYGISSCSGGGCVFSMRSWGTGFGSIPGWQKHFGSTAFFITRPFRPASAPIICTT